MTDYRRERHLLREQGRRRRGDVRKAGEEEDWKKKTRQRRVEKTSR